MIGREPEAKSKESKQTSEYSWNLVERKQCWLMNAYNLLLVSCQSQESCTWYCQHYVHPADSEALQNLRVRLFGMYHRAQIALLWQPSCYLTTREVWRKLHGDSTELKVCFASGGWGWNATTADAWEMATIRPRVNAARSRHSSWKWLLAKPFVLQGRLCMVSWIDVVKQI